ncbi:MAG: hypothetical protein AB7O62_08725 [Pirellulales bacterium]
MLDHLLPRISQLNARLAANGSRVARVIEGMATRIDNPVAAVPVQDESTPSAGSGERVRTDAVLPSAIPAIKKSTLRPLGTANKPRVDSTPGK